MHIHPASIVGASGYTGLELTRLLARHPQVRVASLYSDRWADEAAGARLPLAGELAALRYRPLSEAERAEGEIVFLATPAEVSADLAPKLLARGARVVDLSGAFRLAEPADYPAWYGFAHPAPELLAEARYGLPELARAGLAGREARHEPGLLRHLHRARGGAAREGAARLAGRDRGHRPVGRLGRGPKGRRGLQLRRGRGRPARLSARPPPARPRDRADRAPPRRCLRPDRLRAGARPHPARDPLDGRAPDRRAAPGSPISRARCAPPTGASRSCASSRRTR